MGVLRPEALVARLQELGIVTPAQIEQAKQELVNTQERFSAILVRQGLLRDADIGKRLAPQLGSMPQRLLDTPQDLPVAQRVPPALWHSHRLLPLREADGKLVVATDDPFSVFALDFFARRCGCALEAILVREQDLTPQLTSAGVAVVPSPHPSGWGESSRPASGAPPAGANPTIAPVQAPPLPPGRSRPETPPPPTPPSARPRPQTPHQSQAPPAASVAAPAARAMSSSSHDTASRTATAVAETEDEPIIRLIDSMLSEAVRMRASDVHIEGGREQLRVRYRIDGVLHDVNSPPKALHGPINSRIKIMASLNIAEKRLPQDGRLQLSVEGRPLDVRVSTLPATHGESIVMRLLDRSQPIRGLPEMGLLPDDQARWQDLIHRPHGMVLVTGPTGSGKTTTLYGALAMLNQPDRKLITVEDPVEYQLRGINQVAVRSTIGLTFANGLRAMLRQAPDVIMVGEIRDQETAQIAVQAALTGHLVLSTLHTNDASSAITRLIDMSIAPFLIASTIQGVLAQRLVRRVCPACRMTDNATPEEQRFLGQPGVAQVIRSNGCDKCHGSGFVGRIGVFELLVVTDAIRPLIVSKASASAIRAAALREGMRGLRDDGCQKIREGLTTMSEVLRVVIDE